MESMEQKNAMNNTKSHSCPTGHCCDCAGCGSMGMHGGMKRYWMRHFLVLIFGVILAFCVGVKLGEIKGFIMASYGGMPMAHHGWMMDRPYNGMGNVYETEPPVPTTQPKAQ